MPTKESIKFGKYLGFPEGQDKDSLKLQLETAFNQIGATMLSDEKCCQLLAWLYVYGGGQEGTVTNKNLTADIMIAQKRLNVYGGERPNVNLVKQLQDDIKSLERTDKIKRMPDWCQAIFDKYAGLHNPHSKGKKK